MVRQFRDDTGDPYGGMSLLAADVPCDVHTSSGTTGAPTFLPITERDRSIFAESLARHLWAAGLRPGGVASLSLALYLRPVWPMAEAARRIGARVTFTDWPDLPRVVQTFRYLKPDVHAFLSPPQAIGLRDELARLGLDPKEVLGATRGFVWAGDALTPKSRRLVDEEWGSEAFELSGTGDLCFMMQECGHHDGLHMHDDLWFVEVVEPGTTVPVEEGERGEFLFTSLMDESLAFIRWRSEDIGTATTGRCACGRTNTRLDFLGRVGYRVRVKGRTVFPVEVQRVLEQWEEVDHGLFQIVRTGPDMETLRLRVGTREGEISDPEGLRPRIETSLEDALQLPVRVEYVDAAMPPRPRAAPQDSPHPRVGLSRPRAGERSGPRAGAGHGRAAASRRGGGLPGQRPPPAAFPIMAGHPAPCSAVPPCSSPSSEPCGTASGTSRRSSSSLPRSRGWCCASRSRISST